MKLKIYLFCSIAILCCPVLGKSQQTAFSMLINGSTEIRAVCENLDGNYVATGYQFSGNQADATIMEISPNGAILQQNILEVLPLSFLFPLFKQLQDTTLLQALFTTTSMIMTGLLPNWIQRCKSCGSSVWEPFRVTITLTAAMKYPLIIS
jgi:hypothetical protein